MENNEFEKSTEHKLVAALQQGDQKAISELYGMYAPVLLGVITRIVQHAAIAEEVLQETFVAIWSRILLYDAAKNRFLTWGLAIARGVAIEALKTGKYGHLVNSPENSTFVNPLENEKAMKIYGQLDPAEKAALELIYLKGFSCQQAANALGISEDKLKANLKMAFKHIGADSIA